MSWAPSQLIPPLGLALGATSGLEAVAWGGVEDDPVCISLDLYVPLKYQGATHYGKMVNIRNLNAVLVKTRTVGPSCPTRSWVLGQPFKAKVSIASWLLFNRIQ